MASRNGIASVLANHGVIEHKSKLIEIFSTLQKGGAGQSVGKVYVPAVALYDPQLLSLLLDMEAKSADNYKALAQAMALAALGYVEGSDHG